MKRWTTSRRPGPTSTRRPTTTTAARLGDDARDFRIRITADDVRWYLRTSSTGDPAGPWTLVRNAFDTNNVLAYNGCEPGGRDLFRLFVHASAMGDDGPGTEWMDSDLKIDRILVTVFPEPCPWDCDGSDDGIVGITDFLALLAQECVDQAAILCSVCAPCVGQ